MQIEGMVADVPVVRVFVSENGLGGNPAPVWLNADGLATNDMQALARTSGLESVFVIEADDDRQRWHMRYFVPNHEMEMCGHATIGALWLLHRHGAWDGSRVAIGTLSGPVEGRLIEAEVEISQPAAEIEVLDESAVFRIARCLGVERDNILGQILNASTSRPKTLIRLRHPTELHGLRVDAAMVEGVCEAIGSTGLYPFVKLDGDQVVCSARQFPKSSGYLEDPATGIAAAALAWGLRYLSLIGDESVQVTVHQGESIGSPSRISVRLPANHGSGEPCWIGGRAELDGIQDGR